MIRTRFAPTPSGFLHAGNAWSFVLTWLAARSQGGRIHLRIDDLDADRFREEYLEDIFTSLHWLGLDWDSGPRDAAEFKASFSQRFRLPRYRAVLSSPALQGMAYACDCSRAGIRRAAGTSGIYPGTCRHRGLAPSAEHALRFRSPPEERARDAGGAFFLLHPERDLGDFLLRARSGEPSYHLASVTDDEDLGVNFVVRGMDLMPSTGGQLALARALGFQSFPEARFWHHALMLGEKDGKLSKSRGDASLLALRQRTEAASLYRYFARRLGRDPQGVSSARDLLPSFRPEQADPGPLRLQDLLREVSRV